MRLRSSARRTSTIEGIAPFRPAIAADASAPPRPVAVAAADAMPAGAGTIDSAIVVVADPDGPMAQEMREARAIVLGARDGADDRTTMLVFAGARPGAAVGVVAANFAAASAQLGYRVLLVDADLVAPTQHGLFGLPAGPGLTELLDETASGHAGGGVGAWVPTAVPRLALLGAGATLRAGDGLVERVAVHDALLRTARDFDLVVIDAGGGEPGAVAAVAARTDGVVVVVERHRSAVARVRTLLTGLAARDVTALGSILID